MVDSIHHNYKILVNDKDVTASIKNHFISLQLTDNDQDDADELVLVISSKFKRPSYKDKIKVFLGWGDELKYAGLFYVQKSSIRDNRQLTIKATGVDFNGDLKTRRHLNYDDMTLGYVAWEIAQRHGLELRTNVKASMERGTRFEQINESDLSFLNRLSKEHNIVYNIKNNTLYFMQKGTEVPSVSIDINKCETSNITYSNKTIYKSCKAIYQDTKLNKIASVITGKGKPELVKQGHWLNGTDALLAAKNALARANKDTADGNITTRGQVVFAGSKLELDGETFEVKKVTQNVTKGWKTTLDFKSFEA